MMSFCWQTVTMYSCQVITSRPKRLFAASSFMSGELREWAAERMVEAVP